MIQLLFQRGRSVWKRGIFILDHLSLSLLLSGFLLSQSKGWSGEPPPVSAHPAFLFAAEGARQVQRYDRKGELVWSYPAEMSRDAWSLPNGNILFCYNQNYQSARNDNPSGVMEVTPEKQVVLHFLTTGQVWSCQRLLDGNTLVGAASQGKLLIVNPQAKIVREIKLLNRPGHGCLRNARQLANGHFLVAEESARVVREYDLESRLRREIKVAFAPYSCVRLSNGNTVVCGQQSLVEITPDNQIAWSLAGNEVPGLGIRWFAGLQVLRNGHFFICNAGGKVPFAEISREKKVVWQSPPREPAWPIGHGVQRLDLVDAGLPVLR
jgi:hypothetical protein